MDPQSHKRLLPAQDIPRGTRVALGTHSGRTDQSRRWAWRYKRSPFPVRLGRRIALLLCGAFLLGMGMTAVVLWATSDYYGDIPISGAPLIAALLGGGGAMAIGAGLMAALFYSNRSRWDESAR
jgi:hypothetical protein